MPIPYSQERKSQVSNVSQIENTPSLQTTSLKSNMKPKKEMSEIQVQSVLLLPISRSQYPEGLPLQKFDIT